MSEKYTAEELAMLSDEERAAIAEPEDNVDALKAIADGDESDDDEGEGKADQQVDQPAGEVAAEIPVAEALVETEVSAFNYQYQVDPVENFDARMAEFGTQKTDLRAKFKDGDLDIDAYEEAKDAITIQETALREQKFKADISAEQIEQAGKARWEWEQDRFFKDASNAMYKDKYVLAAFDAAVRDLGGDPKNADWDGAKFLSEADKLVRSRFGVKEQIKIDEKLPAAQRKPDLSVVPKTLSSLPAAEIASTGEVDEFAHIDRLSGLAYEKAVAKLSDAERERFRASA
jgi:hypothetical protein